MRPLLALLLIPFLAPGVAPAAPASTGSLAEQLAQVAGAFPGDASVVVADPQGGFHFTWAADRVVPAASLYKLGVMVEAFRQTSAGTISFDAPTVEITDEDAEDDSYTAPGSVLSVRDAIERMITISDNAPARALLRLVGIARTNDTLRSLGLRATRVNHGLPPEEQTVPYNTTSARDMRTLFVQLLRGNVVGPVESASMLAVLQRQRIQDRLPVGLPEGALIAHKTGNLPDVAHDAGVIFTPSGPRVAVVLTTGFAVYDHVVTLNEQVGALTYGSALDGFAARYIVAAQPQALAPQSPLTWVVQVTNASSFAWTGSVYLRSRIMAAAASRMDDLPRVAIPRLDPGSSALVAVSVPGLAPGTYLLQLEAYDDDLGTSGNKMPLVFEIRR